MHSFGMSKGNLQVEGVDLAEVNIYVYLGLEMCVPQFPAGIVHRRDAGLHHRRPQTVKPKEPYPSLQYHRVEGDDIWKRDRGKYVGNSNREEDA